MSMHRSEEACLVICNDCGVELWVERERGFAMGPDDALCFECAVKRGGVYDETHDRWAVPPRVEEIAVQAT